MNKRRFLTWAGGAALGGGAAAWAWHRLTAPAPFLSRPWTDLAGRPRRVEDWPEHSLLINFWATWCGPCVQEMPLLDAWARQHPRVPVLGLAVDQHAAVQKFLADRPVGFEIGVLGLSGSVWMRELGNPLGGLPFSVLISHDRAIIAQQVGALSETTLDNWARLTPSA